MTWLKGEPSLVQKVHAVHLALTGAGLAHAFGGALALTYHGEPRSTKDIDVNVFVGLDRRTEVLTALTAAGVTHGDRADAERDGWEQLFIDSTPVDVFYAYDSFHDAMARAAELHHFPGGQPLPFLSAEHLAACKVIFDRPKDWPDIEQILFAKEPFDVAECRRWVVHAVGEDDRRVATFDDAAARLRG